MPFRISETGVGIDAQPRRLHSDALCAVALFAIVTAALHRDSAEAEKLKPLIRRFGIAHAGLLCIGLIGLGGMLVEHVLTEPPKSTPICCACCTKGGAN